MCHNHVAASACETDNECIHQDVNTYQVLVCPPHREKNDMRVYMLYILPQLELQPREGLPTRRQSCGPASAATRWRRYKSRSEGTARRSAEVLAAQRESRNPQRPLQPIRSSASGRRAEEG